MIAQLTLRYTYTRKCICTNAHNINIHSYRPTIQINGPIGLFSNKWANGTKYCGLYRISVGNVILFVELGNRSEFLKRIFSWWQLKRMWSVDKFSLNVHATSLHYFVLRKVFLGVQVKKMLDFCQLKDLMCDSFAE